MKYNYSIERVNILGHKETFQVINCDSFDEAIRAVEKGVYERQLKENEKIIPQIPTPPKAYQIGENLASNPQIQITDSEIIIEE